MLLLFGILYCFFSVDFNSISAGKIILNRESPHGTTPTPKHKNVKSSSLKNNSTHDALNRLHQLYHTDLQNKDSHLNQLLILKQQYMLRNHIEEFEMDFALNFVPDWSKVDVWSSTARQGIEIRRQKWLHILRNHSDIPAVQSLNAELVKTGINQSIFCREIAEAYFILSHNSYIYGKGPIVNEKVVEMAELVHCPVMDKSLKIFLHSIPDSDLKFNETEDLVKIPKSLYHKLLRKEAQISLLKKHHNVEDKRKKEIRNSEQDRSFFDHRHSEMTRHRNHTSNNEVLVLIETTSETNCAGSTTVGYDSTSDSSTERGDDSDDNDSDDDSDSSYRYMTWTEEHYGV